MSIVSLRGISGFSYVMFPFASLLPSQCTRLVCWLLPLVENWYALVAMIVLTVKSVFLTAGSGFPFGTIRLRYFSLYDGSIS